MLGTSLPTLCWEFIQWEDSHVGFVVAHRLANETNKTSAAERIQVGSVYIFYHSLCHFMVCFY